MSQSNVIFKSEMLLCKTIENLLFHLLLKIVEFRNQNLVKPTCASGKLVQNQPSMIQKFNQKWRKIESKNQPTLIISIKVSLPLYIQYIFLKLINNGDFEWIKKRNKHINRNHTVAPTSESHSSLIFLLDFWHMGLDPSGLRSYQSRLSL